MAYYFPEEMKKVLDEYPQYRDRLYCRGFLLTSEEQSISAQYPFYSNWSKLNILKGKYYLYTHKDTYCYVIEENDTVAFLVGHAYDPYNMITDENIILKNLLDAKK